MRCERRPKSQREIQLLEGEGVIWKSAKPAAASAYLAAVHS